MQKTLISISALGAVTLLSACGGGGGGLFDAAAFAQYQSDPNIIATTPNATVDALSGSNVSYSGVSQVIDGNGGDAIFYYGSLNMTANFDGNTVSGSAGNFTRFFSSVASAANGQPASGTIALNGSITPANNETFDGAISGTAIGSIGGTTVDGELTGRITGLNGEGMALTIDDDVNDIFGGGLALQ